MPSSAPPPPIVALDAPPPAAPLAQVNQLARVPDLSAREHPQVRQDAALGRRLRYEAVQLLVALEDHETERRKRAFRSGHSFGNQASISFSLVGLKWTPDSGPMSPR